MNYKFKAKDLKTGKYVEGDLAYASQYNYKNHTSSVRPMILTHGCNGGMIWVEHRWSIDENTIELITDQNNKGEV